VVVSIVCSGWYMVDAGVQGPSEKKKKKKKKRRRRRRRSVFWVVEKLFCGPLLLLLLLFLYWPEVSVFSGKFRWSPAMLR
jgi:hypothetical protein